MTLGEIYVWETDKAEGHTLRKKYQIYICSEDGEHLFLFINSVSWAGDYALTQADYTFLTHDSFVSCSSAISYTDAELASQKPKFVGQLSNPHMKGLRDNLIAVEAMERRDLIRVCGALAAAL